MTAPITYESQLPALIAQFMAGSNKSTSGTTTTSNSADTTGLQQVFTNAMTAANTTTPEMQAMMDSIFTEGASKIPELTAAYANATGSRTTGNSGLSLALSELNRQLSSTAISALLQSQTQNRSIASNAATGITDATKSQTKNETQQVQTTPTVAGQNPLLMLLAGAAVNKGDKLGLFDMFKDKNSVDANAATSDANATSGISSVPAGTFDYGGLNSTYAGDNPTLGPATGTSMDLASDFGTSATMADPAAGMLLDPGSGLVDSTPAPDIGGTDFGPSIDYGAPDPGVDFGAVSDPGVDFNDFFKNGGAVTKQPMGYADGGAVRNVNYMGDPSATSPLVNAINGAQPTTPTVTPTPTTPAPVRQESGSTGTTGVTGDTGATGMTDASNTNGQVGTPAQNQALVQGFVNALLGVATGVPGIGMIANAVTGGRSLVGAGISAAGTAVGNIGQGIADAIGSVTPGSISAPTSADAPSTGNGDSVDGGVSDGGIGGVGGGTGAASSGVGSAAGGVAAFSDGGPVSGPGTGTSDSIDAKVSDGEYIFPASVVRYFGTRMLDKMKNSIHQPT